MKSAHDLSDHPLAQLFMRYRLASTSQIAKLLGVSFEAARSRCRRFEKKGILSRQRIVGGLVYWVVSKHGGRLLNAPPSKTTRSAATIFVELAITEYFSANASARLTLLTPDEFKDVLRDLERSTGVSDFAVPGLQWRRHFFNHDTLLTRVLIDSSLPSGFDANRLMDRIRKKASSLRRRSPGWRYLLDNHGAAFMLLTPSKSRVADIEAAATKTDLRVAASAIPLLAHSWGIRHES